MGLSCLFCCDFALLLRLFSFGSFVACYCGLVCFVVGVLCFTCVICVLIL